MKRVGGSDTCVTIAVKYISAIHRNRHPMSGTLVSIREWFRRTWEQNDGETWEDYCDRTW